MADLPLGNVPLSTIEDSDNIVFTEGQYAKKIAYSDVKIDMLGSANLATTAPKTKEAINELVQDLLESTGYGVVSGGVVTAQSTPNMTVQVSSCTLKTATGSRQVVAAIAALVVTTADTTNPRKDIVYVDSTGAVQYLQGTAAASPTAPTTPTGGSLLAEIYVAANAVTITSANITDKRKMLISTDQLNADLSDVAHKTGTMQVNLNADMVDGIQGNQIPLKTNANITYYVNASTGADTNDGLTSSTAFKTIQVAINKIPQVVNHTVNINVSSGTYSENLSIAGFEGAGKIILNGDTIVSSTRNILTLTINQCSCLIRVIGFACNPTISNDISISQCINVELSYMNLITSSNYIGVYATNSYVYVHNATISNKNTAIQAFLNGNIAALSISGSNNSIAFSSLYNSSIGKDTNTVTGTTQEQTTGGGVIRNEVENPTITLLTGWTSVGSAYTYCRKSNKVVQLNMLVTNTSATNVNDYIGKLDATVLPPYIISISIVNRTTGAIIPGYINQSGYIYPSMSGLSANTQYSILVSYIL